MLGIIGCKVVAVAAFAGMLAGSASCLAQTPAGPPPIPAVLSVTSMGIVKQNPAVLGRDGTYSALINGRSYWAFNDTAMTAPDASGKNFIDNTIASTATLDASSGITLDHDQTDSSGLPTRFVPFTPGEAYYQRTHDSAHCTADPCGANLGLWPGPIVYNPRSQQVIVPFGEIWRTPTVDGWQVVGSGLAMGRLQPDGTMALRRPVQNPGAQYPTLMWGPDEIAFTDQAFIIGDMYYAYGGKAVFVTTQDFLARVPVAKVLTKSAWQYYTGNGVWSSNVADAVPLFDGGAAGSSVFFNKYLGLWMAIYSGNFTNKVYYRVAYQPEGPWSDQKLLFIGLRGYKNSSDYAGRAHPEFSPDDGQTQYITYVRNTGFLQQQLPLTKVVFGPAQ